MPDLTPDLAELRRLAELARDLPSGSDWFHGEVSDGIETVAEWMDKCSANPDALAAGRLSLVWSEGSGETKVIVQAIVGDTETAPIRAAFIANANPAVVLALLAERDALAAKVEWVRDWLDHRGVDVSDRDSAYMDGYRAAQRHAVTDAAELRAALDGADA